MGAISMVFSFSGDILHRLTMEYMDHLDLGFLTWYLVPERMDNFITKISLL
jgi:hypothetical protein